MPSPPPDPILSGGIAGAKRLKRGATSSISLGQPWISARVQTMDEARPALPCSPVVKRSADRLLFLARHGETAWNQAGRWQGKTDIPLSDAGRAQARALGACLVGRGIVEVHASDLQRAAETAEIVAGMLGIAPLKVDARLRERGFGCFEGFTPAECAERYPEAWARYVADRRATPPGGEPQTEVAARAVAALTELACAPRAARRTDAGGIARRHDPNLHPRSHGYATPPLENGALFVARWAGERFVSVTRA